MAEFSYRLTITAFFTVLGGSFQFYNIPVINEPQNILKTWINQTYIERSGVYLSNSGITWLFSFIASSACLGALIGSILNRALAEGCGRRNALIVNGIVTVFGSLAVGISKGVASPELLLIGRIILGFSVGLTSGLVPLYLTEIAPIKYRGSFATTHQISVAFSDFFSLLVGLPQILGTEDLWPLSFALSAVPALMLCAALPFCAESPRYLLITRGNREQAEKAMKFFVGEDHYRGAMEVLIREAARSQASGAQKTVTTRNMIRLKHLRTPLLISVLCMVAQQFTGVAAVFSYSTDMFIQANLSERVARISTLAVGFGYFATTVPALWLVEKLGRRTLSLCQLTGCLIALSLMSLFTGLQNDYGYSWASYGSIAALVFYMCVYGIGSPIPWMMSSELFTQEYRSAAVGISTFVAWFLAFVISLLYLLFQEAVGAAFSFLPFIVVLAFSIFLMFLFLPETRGKTIDQIVDEFRDRRHSVSTRISRAFSTSTVGGAESEPLLRSRPSSPIDSKGSVGKTLTLYTTGARRFSKKRLSTQSEENDSD